MEGAELEVEERSMTGWCLVRTKGGQEEKVVSAVSRGWEEYKERFPHRAFLQRLHWSRGEGETRVLAWLEAKKGSEEKKLIEEELMEMELQSYRNGGCGRQARVEKWLRGGWRLGKD